MTEAKGELIVLHDRRDRLEANRLVRKLESEGFRVARQDPTAPRRGKSESPTVVLWSRHASGRGLRSALDSAGAVVAKVDSRMAPSGAKVTDLRGWRGQDRHLGWKTLLEAVAPAQCARAPAIKTAPIAPVAATLEAKAPAKTTKAKSAPEAKPAKTSGAGAIAIGVIAAIVVFAAGAALFLL